MQRKRFAVLFSCLALVIVAALGVQQCRQRSPRDIPVLMYHNVLPAEESDTVWKVTADEFRRQMDDLRDAGYSTILPEDIYRASHGWGWLPRKPVVITFDDGYEGVLRHAEPILREHGFRAICYAIVNRLGADGEPRPSFDSGPLLTADEAAAMHTRGTVAIGVHSLTHGRNPRLLAAEAQDGRHVLKARTGIKSRHYCYPFGVYSQPYMREAVIAGKYHTALICDDRMFHYTPSADLLAIPRLSVYGGQHDIQIVATDPAAGTVTVCNDGDPLPLKAVVRDAKTGAVIAESPAARIGPKPCTLPIEGNGFPSDALLELRDTAGLFRYGAYAPFPVVKSMVQ